MANPNKDVKVRPVDALFGESTAPALPGYIIEPPQPVSTVSPPTPDQSPPSSETDTAGADAAAPAPPMLEPNIPTAEPIAVSSVAQPLANDSRFAQLAERIERLYGEVKMDLRDSKVATDFCFQLLMQARQAIEARDYPRAEFFVQSVDAKLKRSAKSMKAAFSLGVIFLWLWESLALGAGGGMIALTYVVNLTLFGLPVAPEFVVLLRVEGWGIIGGVIGALYNLPWFIQFREYDPAYNMNYFARPLVGMLVAAMLFLIAQTGILAGNINLPSNAQLDPVFLYVIAALAGFKQEYVTEFFDNLLKTILRVPQVPDGLKPPQAPK